MLLKLFSKKTNKILSFDFGTSSIKVVEGKVANNKIVVTNAADIKLPMGLYSNGLINNTQELANVIKAGLSTNKMELGPAYGVINNSSIITREVLLPKVSDNEISAILEYQLNEYFPVDPENYVVQHINQGVVNTEDGEKLNVLLIGVPKVMVVKHFELMNEVGLTPKALDYQGNAILKLFKFNENVNHSIKIKDNTIAVVDIGMDSTKIIIIKDNVIKVNRIIEIGSNNLLDELTSAFSYSRDYLETYVHEINDINENIDMDTDYYRILMKTKSVFEEIMEACEMTFRYYRSRETGNVIDYILIHGGLQNVKGTEKMFSDFFNIPCDKIKDFDNIKNNFYYSMYANAIGGLIRAEEV